MVPSLSGLFVDLAIIGILIFGIRWFRTPVGARRGNLAAAVALALAVLVTLMRDGVVRPEVVLIAALAGSFAGWIVAMRVTMIQIPAMVAFQHGAGGVAAFLVALVELMRLSAGASAVGQVSGIVGLVVGAATFSGSIVASGKLAKKLSQTPVVLPGHNLVLLAFTLLAAILGTVAFNAADPSVRLCLFVVLILVSTLLGIVFSIRIGGADMPVLISFLNATAGLAAAFCGVIIQNKLLIACGATVAASGSILTHVMCRAMNRSLAKVFVGIKTVKKTAPNEAEPAVHFFGELDSERPVASSGHISAADRDDPVSRAASALKEAGRVVVIPGYGMALAQAQFKVLELMNLLEGMGKTVKFAIHPVAGRMPGHMNVLLAEADIPYDKLFEMDEINGEFPETDVALIVGACDVVNPAAIETEGTPISGMPILMAHQAKHVIVCNLDEKPGYSGVENPLYESGNAILIFGDAGKTVETLAGAVRSGESPVHDENDSMSRAASALKGAGRVVVIPGYGMALAQAQFKVLELMNLLEGMGKTVKFAIHPVAGRMPGHMNVLLAEADIPYDKLFEMDEINGEFPETDVALIVGACDVVNPAAIETEGTPISGMPILMAHQANRVIVCNLDEKPGYSGVENPLYESGNAILLFGDAGKTLEVLIESVKT